MCQVLVGILRRECVKKGSDCMKKWIKYLVASLVILLLLLSLGLSQLTYSPTETAEEVAQTAKVEDNVRIFEAEDPLGPAIVFYQGAFVEAAAYAPLARQLAAAGFDVYLLDSPFNLPVLAEQSGLKVVEDYQLNQVIFMGHSLGGVIAARNAAAMQAFDQVAGLVLLASYPDQSTELVGAEFPILSITASMDEVLNQAAFAEAIDQLPETTLYKEIKGGNHSGFGDYGPQAQDGPASLTASEQKTQVVRLLIEAFRP